MLVFGNQSTHAHLVLFTLLPLLRSCHAGGNGRPVGEWYVQMGLEAPKKPRDKDMHNATSPAANVFLDRHERHHNKTVAAAAAAVAAAAPTPRTRALRAARHSHPAGGQRGRRGQSAEDVAVPASWEEPTLAGSGSGSGSAYPPDAMGAWGGMYQQQQGMSTAASLAGASSLQFQPGANPLAVNSAADASAAAMDAAALNWSQQQQQMEATAAIPAAAAAAAYAAAVSGEYAVVPVSAGQQGLPGDTSLAVIEMGAYLQGLRSTPPWRLLPISQRPLIGTQLVPLRQLFIMVSLTLQPLGAWDGCAAYCVKQHSRLGICLRKFLGSNAPAVPNIQCTHFAGVTMLSVRC